MKIAIVNRSPLFDSLQKRGDELDLIVQAVSQQLFFHVGPAWNSTGGWDVVRGTDATPTEDTWTISIFDATKDASMLGFHSVDPNGNPYGAVFMSLIPGLDLLGPQGLSTVVSHEAIETALDPGVNVWADQPTPAGVPTRSWAYELCDPVESDSYPIDISLGGEILAVHVSNFVCPPFFGGPRYSSNGGFYDWVGNLTQPFSIDSEGYAVVRSNDGTPQEVFGSKYPEHRRAKKAFEGSRSSRRRRAK